MKYPTRMDDYTWQPKLFLYNVINGPSNVKVIVKFSVEQTVHLNFIGLSLRHL